MAALALVWAAIVCADGYVCFQDQITLLRVSDNFENCFPHFFPVHEFIGSVGKLINGESLGIASEDELGHVFGNQHLKDTGSVGCDGLASQVVGAIAFVDLDLVAPSTISFSSVILAKMTLMPAYIAWSSV